MACKIIWIYLSYLTMFINERCRARPVMAAATYSTSCIGHRNLPWGPQLSDDLIRGWSPEAGKDGSQEEKSWPQTQDMCDLEKVQLWLQLQRGLLGRRQEEREGTTVFSKFLSTWPKMPSRTSVRFYVRYTFYSCLSPYRFLVDYWNNHLIYNMKGEKFS